MSMIKPVATSDVQVHAESGLVTFESPGCLITMSPQTAIAVAESMVGEAAKEIAKQASDRLYQHRE